MFPFGYEYGDDYIYEDGGIELSGDDLGFRVPFMGMEYNYTFVSTEFIFSLSTCFIAAKISLD